MSITEAARRLERHPHWVKGAVEALGIKLVPGGTALLMSEEDFARLKKHDASLNRAPKRPRTATA